jgi:hypothetical protein
LVCVSFRASSLTFDDIIWLGNEMEPESYADMTERTLWQSSILLTKSVSHTSSLSHSLIVS